MTSVLSVPGRAGAAGGKGDFAGVPISITNSLSVPVDVYDCLAPPSGQIAPYIYTKLGTIGAGATGTVTTIHYAAALEATYSGTVPELQGWFYHRFPIKLMSGMPIGSDPPPSYTIVDSDRKAMIDSFRFYKYVMANPNSTLAQNFTTALKSTEPHAVNTFFTGTSNFKNCTQGTWQAAVRWLTTFTSGWQGPYYLYEAAPTDPPPNYVPALVGTLDIVSTAAADEATLTLCTQDSTGKLQKSSPAQGATVVMAGDGTMTDANAGQDISVTLTPVWANAVQTTMDDKQPTTSFIAGPALIGTVGGRKVVSTQTLIPLPSKGGSGGSGSSGASGQTFGTICQVVGLIVGLVMLYEIVEKRLGAKDTATDEARGESTSESDFQSRAQTIDQDAAGDISRTVTEQSGTITKDAQGVADGYQKIADTQKGEVLGEAADEAERTMDTEISEQIENGFTPTEAFDQAVGDARESFSTAREQIQKGDLADAGTTIEQTRTTIQQTIEQNAATMQQSEVKALQESADTVGSATEQADELDQAKEQYERDMSSETDDSGFPEQDTTPATEETTLEA